MPTRFGLSAFHSALVITLRAFHPDDESSLIALANNERVTRYLRDNFPRPYTRRDARYWIEEGSSNDMGQHFAIALDGECIGGAGVYWGKGEFQYSGEIGYWLGEPYWGRGYATRALRLLTNWILANTELHRLYAQVIEPNQASIRVLEKGGYEREGILRKAVCKRGVIYDEQLFSKIRDR